MKQKRTFAIGDIHGAYLALIQCLNLSKFDYENDTLVCLGDVADGWSQVPECVEELLKIKNLISLRGNHDVWCWNWFTMGERPAIWTEQGGRATIEAYIKSGKIGDKVHKDFWDNQIDYFIDEENRLFVHAGFSLIDGFENSAKTNMNIKNANEYHWARDLAELLFPTEDELSQINKFKEIFIGHTAHSRNPTSFNKFNIWNLDTGAGWNGVLTIMNVDTKEYFQSDNVLTLYKNERGRT